MIRLSFLCIILAITSCSSPVKKGNLKVQYILTSADGDINSPEVKTALIKRLTKAGYPEEYLEFKKFDQNLMVTVNYADNEMRIHSLLSDQSNVEFARTFTLLEILEYVKGIKVDSSFEKNEPQEIIDDEPDNFFAEIEESSDSVTQKKPKYLVDYFLVPQHTTQVELAIVSYSQMNIFNKILDTHSEKFPKNLRFLWSIKGNDNQFKLYAIHLENNGKPAMHGDLIAHAEANYNQMQQPEVRFEFNEQASQDWEKLTSNSIGKCIAIILDGRVVMAPKVHLPIRGGKCSLSGNFTHEETIDLANILPSQLPCTIEILSSTSEKIK